jgi:hypothetical protein
MALGPKHWLERAEHARTIASWMRNERAKRLLLEIAERYAEIASLPGGSDLGPPIHASEAENSK